MPPSHAQVLPMNKHAFATVVLDVDSTISGVEGIQWLAARRGDIVARRVASLTHDARTGAAPYETVYAARLAAIRPRRDEVDALSRAYVDAIDPYCAETVRRLSHAGVRVILVTSGFRHALVRLAFYLSIDLADVHAVDIRFDALGAYTGYDASSPLTRRDGKRDLIATLDIDRPVLAVGDGLSDLAMRGSVDAFAAYTGFIAQERVVRQADLVLESFSQLASAVLA